ncbi:MAG: response regulator [Acidobacteria bacterium]|nr:response regulator [Acidobacteriota bacterium]
MKLFGGGEKAVAGEKVLVVDDDRVILQLLEVNLEMEGYDVRTAANGEQALSDVKVFRPDIVILDIMMPRMDGMEVCRRIQADPASADVPVVFLSAKAQDLDVRRGYELGVAAYLTKPFDPQELIDTVERVLAGERVLPPGGP